MLIVKDTLLLLLLIIIFDIFILALSFIFKPNILIIYFYSM